MNMNIKLIMW